MSTFRPGLDQQALATTENQESFLKTRKELTAQAKAFRLSSQSVETELFAKSDIQTTNGVLASSLRVW